MTMNFNFPKVELRQPEHRYFNLENGEEYTSTTTFLQEFEVPFDSEYQSRRYALKHGRTQEDVLQEWEDIRVEACERGTFTHTVLEKFIKSGVKVDLKRLLANFDKINFEGELHSEQLLCSPEHKLAGTADIVEVIGDTVNIWDFKTNRKGLNFTDPWGKFLKPPVEHLDDTKLSKYRLQLSLYARYLEQVGMKVGRLVILWVHPLTFDIIKVEGEYMEKEIDDILRVREEKLEEEQLSWAR